MTESDNHLLTAEYSLIRLVYVNSANHAYSEIMLDSHMAMFGDNNVGKTASLAGTKLLLFPEVNFYKCESKFGFKGKSGLYSMEESYEFYFPDARSFIVLEVENPEGRFCMVLYRRSDFSYGRFFIPAEYEKLRPVFWNSEAGDFSSDLSVDHLDRFSKENNGVQVSNRKDIAAHIFSGYRGTKLQQRFCILPLKDDRNESITAFCNIYQLAFESGELEEKTLPKAISTLLEMGRSRDKERLDANLVKLASEHGELHKKGQLLQRLSNSKPTFERVQKQADEANAAIRDYSFKWLSLNKALEDAKINYTTDYNKISQPHKDKQRELDEVSRAFSRLDIDISKQDGAISTLAKSLKRKESDLIKAKEKKSKYSGHSTTDILKILEEHIKDEKKKLNDYRNEGGTQKVLASNIEKKNKLIKEIEGLSELIEKSESSLLFGLKDDFARSVLYSINPAFADISKSLNDSDRQSILNFTELFSNEAGLTYFIGQRLGDVRFREYDADLQVKAWQKKIDTATQDKEDLDKDIREQNKAIQHEDIDSLIRASEKEVRDSEKDFTDISGIETLERDIEELNKEITEKRNKIEEQQNERQKLTEKRKKIEGEFNQLDGKLKQLMAKKEQFDSIGGGLKMASNIMRPITVDKIEPASNDSLTRDYINELINLATECNNAYNRFREGFQALLNELPHDDVDPHQERFTISNYDADMQIYKTAFQTLEYDMQQYQNAVRSHNQLVNNQLNELKEARTLLERFVQEINAELNSKTVSNLSEIRLAVELNPAFLSLLSTLDLHDIQDDSLLEPQFYESLSKFVERYFDKGNRRLKMSDIISSISYHYTLSDTGEVVTKSQSGGTTSAITAFVLAVLLKRITPSYILLRMPIIVDEIGVLDSSNTDSTIQQITDHGFSVFCATPTFSALVSQKVGRWIMIDKWVIKQPLVPKCHINVLPEHVDSFGDKVA